MMFRKAQASSRKVKAGLEKAIADSKKAKADSRKAIANSEKALTDSKKAKAGSKKTIAHSFSKALVVKDIEREARALNIPVGAAEKYAEKIAEKVEKWVCCRGGVTQADIDSVIAREAEKYNNDLAFVYKNRGKII